MFGKGLTKTFYPWDTPSNLWYKTHLSRKQICRSLRCSWTIACRHCSNYIFILNLKPGLNGLGKVNCKTSRESFKFWDLVHQVLILEILWYSPFLSFFVPRYKDGQDHMGEHRDDERELVRESPIASLSLGQHRDFVFKHADSRGRNAKRKIAPISIELEHGCLLMMNHPTNTYWYHSLPVRKKVPGIRINMTFRHFKVPPKTEGTSKTWYIMNIECDGPILFVIHKLWWYMQ